MKVTFCFFALLGSAVALCPGDDPCSRQGTCGQNDKCTCYVGYTGQDCSMRTCNYHTSWNSIAQEAVDRVSDSGATVAATADSANGGNTKFVKHIPTECSSKGECDRDSGECQCVDGFTGKGCRRMTCDGGDRCNGHGQCRTLSDAARDAGWYQGYTGWDKDMIQRCKCDPGWEGDNCNSRTCPKGDDPITTGQVPTKVFLGTGKFAGGVTAGNGNTVAGNPNIGNAQTSNAKDDEFILVYTDGNTGKVWKTWAINAKAPTAIAIEEALEALPNQAIPSVTVTENTENLGGRDATALATLAAGGSKIFEITFDDPRNSGPQTLAVELAGCQVDGCAPVYQGIQADLGGNSVATGSGARVYTSADGANGVITFTDDGTDGTDGTAFTSALTAVTGTTELAACSGRGTCNSEDGLCECYDGYTGNACQTQTTTL